MKIVTNLFITEEEIKQILWDVYSGYGEASSIEFGETVDGTQVLISITFVKDQEV